MILKCVEWINCEQDGGSICSCWTQDMMFTAGGDQVAAERRKSCNLCCSRKRWARTKHGAEREAVRMYTRERAGRGGGLACCFPPTKYTSKITNIPDNRIPSSLFREVARSML